MRDIFEFRKHRLTEKRRSYHIHIIRMQILFKFVIRDSEYYYEYTQPEIYIGESLVLSDGKATPTPVKNNGTEIDSGRFGDWNDFNGWFNIF